MRILEISKYAFERHPNNPRRFYAKILSNGTDMVNRFHHRKILWLGLYFFELRFCLYSHPN